LPPNTPRLWLFLALLADPLTQPLIGPRCGIMTISPANMRRVFSRLHAGAFPTAHSKHTKLRTAPVAAPTRTPVAATLSTITAGPTRAPMLAPTGTMVSTRTYAYLTRRARQANESRARTAGILAGWSMTMNPTPVPSARTRLTDPAQRRTHLVNVLMDADTHTRFAHYAREHTTSISGAIRHLLEWAQHIEETTTHRAHIDRPSSSRFRG
jgi:hypothetical protein